MIIKGITKNNRLFPICLFFFKLINRKHLKDQKIIKIKGYRTAILESKSGQRVTSEFVWWIFKTKIERRWAKITKRSEHV